MHEPEGLGLRGRYMHEPGGLGLRGRCMHEPGGLGLRVVGLSRSQGRSSSSSSPKMSDELIMVPCWYHIIGAML